MPEPEGATWTVSNLRQRCPAEWDLLFHPGALAGKRAPHTPISRRESLNAFVGQERPRQKGAAAHFQGPGPWAACFCGRA